MTELQISKWTDLQSYLFNFIKSKVKDPDDSKDILQDVFLKVHSKIDSLRDSEKFQSWIFQITRNTINDHFKKNVYDFSEMIIEETEEEKDLTENLSNCINGMIDQLPSKYREAIYLSEIKGVSQKELSDKLEMSYSGTKSRVQRGRNELKKLILNCCNVDYDIYGNIIDYNENCKNC